MTTIFQRLLASAIFICISAETNAQEKQNWYKNETTCAKAEINIYSYCIDEPDSDSNLLCSDQRMSITNRQTKKTVEIPVLKYERYDGNFHTLQHVRCLNESSARPYLYLRFANGGNCNDCEVTAIMDLQGKWLRRGKRWFIKSKYRRTLLANENAWYDQAKPVYLDNKILTDDR